MAERDGQQLGNYRLLKLLGQGGFAEVYLGEHIYLGTKAAIKLLYTRVAQDEVNVFQQEARTLANLMHPNIVRVLEFGIEASTNTPYLVMDYAPGGTLRQRHPKGSRLPVPTIVTYVKQVAAALQYAHDQKFIHRDVKPENMLIGRNGEVLLSDFGIALLSQSSRYQSTKDMAGTIAYMAPEQIEAHPRPASDQYSLGIVVYEWLTGARPFNGSFSEVAVKHSVMPPPPLRTALPTLSPAVEQVVMTALAKKPEERFGSVRAFATALEQASYGVTAQPVHAPIFESPSPIALNTLPIEQPIERPPAVLAKEAQLMSSPSAITTQPPLEQREIVTPTPRGISRRTMLLGLGGIVAVGAIGTGVWWLTNTASAHKPPIGTPQAHSSPTSAPQTSPTPIRTPQASPSPINAPQGTVYVVYRGHTNTLNGVYVDGVKSVSWSPNGQRIASGGGDGTVQVWDAASGGNAFIYRGHTATVNSVAWSPDGKRIASAGYDKTVQVWDAASGGNAFTHSQPDIVWAVAWSPDSTRIASVSGTTLQVWDAATGNMVYNRGYSNLLNSVAWSPDGTRIALGSVDYTVQIWDAASGGNAFVYRGHTSRVFAVAWSPNSARIASGSDDGQVQVWDAANGNNALTYRGHTTSILTVAWSPNGQRIASGGGDKTVQVWNAVNGGNAFVYRRHTGEVWSAVWSPNGQRIASGSEDLTVQVWQAV
jgi:WD40 repeat protein